jgi:carbon-monoxide dehydrogenase large subunit
MPEDMGGPKGYRTLRPILSSGKVRAVGDRVAFVVAETLQQARDAAELIAVDYEPLPAVVALEDAVKPGAPVIWDGAPDNVAVALMMGSKEATDAAFAGAKHVVSLKLVNNRVRPIPSSRARQSANIIPSTKAIHFTQPRRIRTGTARTSPATC